jgi:sugar/nucleoside kinase (ribokinase family)
MVDIVGLGAINLDFIIDSTQTQKLNPRDRDYRLASFEQGIERGVSQEVVQEALERLSDLSPKISPGGSALNTVATVASTSAPISVGYVGVCGRSPDAGFDFANWFSVLGIDTTHMLMSEEVSGVCVSYTQGHERSMLTTSGANWKLQDFISENYDAILSYLSSARCVHLTALADKTDPGVIASLLRDLKSRFPSVTISIDPGALWSPFDRLEGVNDILQVADLVFANSREFDLLTRRLPNMTDLDAAMHLFRSGINLRTVILLKRYDHIKAFSRVGAEVIQRVYANSIILSDDEIVDDTGAGDVFAGGMICGSCIPAFETEHSIELGLRLARSKLRFVGMTGIAEFRHDFLDLSAEVVAQSRAVDAESPQKRIFIGHGHDAQWRLVKDCVTGWGLRATYFESAPAAGRFVSEVLTEQALGADFAVIVVTGDDEDSAGHPRGRQNVVHEIGLMQGRLGWTKVAVLLEDGVEPFSNIAGLQYIPFSKGKVHQALHELETTLVREGLILPPVSSSYQ